MSASASAAERHYVFQGLPLTVSSEAPAMTAALDARLRACATDAAAPAEVRLEYVHAVPDPPADEDDLRPVYDTRHGDVVYRPADDTVHARFGEVGMRVDPGAGHAIIGNDGFGGDSVYIAAHPLTMIALIEILKRRARYSLHTACLARDGRGVLVQGPSGSGKSTLALALAAGGLDFLSDDMVFLTRDDADAPVMASGFSDAIGVTDGTIARFSELESLTASAPEVGYRKRLFRIEERFGVNVVPSCRPVALVFPELDGEAPESRLEPMDPQEAFMRLVPDVLITHPETTKAHLSTLAALTEQVECHRLVSSPDVAQGARLVADLL